VQAALALVAVRVILPALFSRDFSCAPFLAAALFNNLELVKSCWLLLLGHFLLKNNPQTLSSKD